MYVWCDALSNYVTAVGYGRDGKEFKKWWPAEIHVIGKDILRFHAAIWPAMLLSAGLALPKRIYVHGFITADGEKMSKSLGNVVDPVAVAKKYGSDAVRYYLLREIPSDGDGDFNQRRFEECYNADLANGLGNFASRVTTLAQRAGDLGKSKVSREVRVQIDNTAALVRNDIERFKLHTAVARVWGLIKFGDGYINDHKPWETQDKTVIANALYLLGAIARLVEPITPGAAARITAAIRTVGGKPAGAQKIENLFPRLDA
jgi:methionyl-tRNA synthetase